ncbi:hypothetical protein Hanom_Chr13g01242841 [Helianthus anomalus]
MFVQQGNFTYILLKVQNIRKKKYENGSQPCTCRLHFVETIKSLVKISINGTAPYHNTPSTKVFLFCHIKYPTCILNGPTFCIHVYQSSRDPFLQSESIAQNIVMYPCSCLKSSCFCTSQECTNDSLIIRFHTLFQHFKEH